MGRPLWIQVRVLEIILKIGTAIGMLDHQAFTYTNTGSNGAVTG
jgi:hypothetical protein